MSKPQYLADWTYRTPRSRWGSFWSHPWVHALAALLIVAVILAAGQRFA
jgi:hypothetical protein